MLYKYVVRVALSFVLACILCRFVLQHELNAMSCLVMLVVTLIVNLVLVRKE